MCLHRDENTEARLLKQLQKDGSIVAYKVFMYCNGHMNGICFDYKFKKGFNIAKKNQSFESKEHDRAFHVNLTEERAKEWESETDIILPVRCFKEDFIAAGHNEATFSRIYIDPKDYEQGLQELKRLKQERYDRWL